MEMIRCLEIILAALRQSLRPDSVLAKSGLVRLDRRAGRFDHAFDLLSNAFAERMMMDEVEPVELIRDVVYRSSEPSLGLGGDFAVISRQSRLNKVTSPETLLSRLREEYAFREGAKRPIGFLH